jgi:hypothetical protein
MNNSTAIEKLESLFYNEANPTINTNSWVIEEKAFRGLIEAAKLMEKEQIIKAYATGYVCEEQHRGFESPENVGIRYYKANYESDIEI